MVPGSAIFMHIINCDNFWESNMSIACAQVSQLIVALIFYAIVNSKSYKLFGGFNNKIKPKQKPSSYAFGTSLPLNFLTHQCWNFQWWGFWFNYEIQKADQAVALWELVVLILMFRFGRMDHGPCPLPGYFSSQRMAYFCPVGPARLNCLLILYWIELISGPH